MLIWCFGFGWGWFVIRLRFGELGLDFGVLLVLVL